MDTKKYDAAAEVATNPTVATQDTELEVHPRFSTTLRRQTEEEQALLKESLQLNGCMSPLISWRGYLVDGHNRYRLCNQLGIPYRVVALDEEQYPTEDDVLSFIADTQAARRNENSFFAAYRVGKAFNRRREEKAIRDASTTTSLIVSDVANEYGVSVSTVKRNGNFSQGIDRVSALLGEEKARSIISNPSVFSMEAISQLRHETDPDAMQQKLDDLIDGGRKTLIPMDKTPKLPSPELIDKSGVAKVLNEILEHTDEELRPIITDYVEVLQCVEV